MVLHQQSWREIRPEDITHLTVKAEGAGAVVYHGFLPSSTPGDKDIIVALRKPRITSTAAIGRFEDELRLRATISHPNLLPLLAACDNPPNYCTVSPWMAGGSMFDLIHTEFVDMSFERILRLSLQLANAIQYLHHKNLVHRDIKTANILLDARWENIVVADLDLAADVNELRTAASINAGRALHRGPSNGRLSHMVGTLVYMAPEVLSGAPHSFAADAYAFAITINELAAAAVPFVDRKMPVPELHTVLETRFNEVRLRSAIVKNHLRPILPMGVSDEFKALIEICWQHDVDARPSFDYIVESLHDMVSRGEVYFDEYAGTTLQSRGSEANQFCESDTTNVYAEILEASRNPSKPVWENTKSNTANVTSGQNPPSESLDVSGALSSTSGERGKDSMEDRSLVAHHLSGLPETHLFAVFDGHAGPGCAEFAVKNIQGAIFRKWGKEEATPESVLVHAFEDVDYAFLKSRPDDHSGSTALAALLIAHKIYVANAGDCRCVLGKKDGTAVVLSKDHVATDTDEGTRVLARGGFVSVTGRVQGCLIVSRAMGDRSVKQFISSTPEVITHDISDDDDFLILASDGLWDVITSAGAVALVKATARVPDLSAKRLALMAMELGSDDNISVIVVFLRGKGSISSVVKDDDDS